MTMMMLTSDDGLNDYNDGNMTKDDGKDDDNKQ